MTLRQKMGEFVPDAYYSNGKQANCLIYKIFNMFDVDSQSFKQVNEISYMKKQTTSKPGNLNVDLGKKTNILEADDVFIKNQKI